MAVKKAVKIAQDPMDEMEPGQSATDSVNADFAGGDDSTEGYNAAARAINPVVDIHNLIMQKGNKELKRAYNEMVQQKQKELAAQARKKRVNLSPDMDPNQAMADDSTQGL